MTDWNSVKKITKIIKELNICRRLAQLTRVCLDSHGIKPIAQLLLSSKSLTVIAVIWIWWIVAGIVICRHYRIAAYVGVTIVTKVTIVIIRTYFINGILHWLGTLLWIRLWISCVMCTWVICNAFCNRYTDSESDGDGDDDSENDSCDRQTDRCLAELTRRRRVAGITAGDDCKGTCKIRWHWTQNSCLRSKIDQHRF